MAKQWFSSKDLIKIEGLPSTPQGINRKARVEGWKSRKRSGIQGKAVEYHIDSFPDFVKSTLQVKEKSRDYKIDDLEPLQLWISAFNVLKEEQKEFIKNWLIHDGVNGLISVIEQQMISKK
ncbi:DNA-binding protein [Frischella perrara]|jgi:Mu DNA-binding domain.|uniref:Mu DNA-binding domain protein n=1 Tax=Frischella perrara TaxID=1267021 RepID=A0A0A7S2B0_FRIPE|nr:DNA-binding protein [Frischella perrara]AJA45690.1 Mu DNA-binding domain protein [Frischella perrara]PWV60777.1 Mu DNA-binding protein [Frischella perrara]